MDRLDAMTTLLAAVETGSLSAAARKLGMPLATVSRKVADLEAHLRTRLLVRGSRRLALTDAGRGYVAACTRILEQVGEAERAAAGEYSAPRGEMIITAPVVFGRLHVLPVITDFLAAFPDIDIRLTLADRMVNLLEEHADVAVRIGALPDSSLTARRVGTIRRITAASPAYLAAHPAPRHPADLADHACVTFDILMSPSIWPFSSPQGPIAIEVRSRLSVSTAEAAIDAAIAGIGITRVLSYQAGRAFAEGTLLRLLRDFEPAPSPVSLLTNAQGLLPQKTRAFLDFAAPRLKARLDALPAD